MINNADADIFASHSVDSLLYSPPKSIKFLTYTLREHLAIARHNGRATSACLIIAAHGDAR